MDKCLLVKGWRAADGWGFPTGKINKDEADDSCAVREARRICPLPAAAVLCWENIHTCRRNAMHDYM